MSETPSRSPRDTQKRYLVIGLLGILVILLALGLNFWLDSVDEAEPESAPPVAVAPAPPVSVVPRGEPATAPAGESAVESEQRSAEAETPPPGDAAAPEAPAAGPVVADAPEAGEAPSITVVPRPDAVEDLPNRPSFDIARVTPGGDAVLAGRAAPGAEVTVHDADRALGSVTADSRGEWVLVVPEPLAPGSHELGLSARLGEGEPAQSDSVVVVVVPETGKDIAGAETAGESGALALEVPREGFGATNVLQKPPGTADPEQQVGAEFSLSVDVLDYDEAGNISLSGRARAGSDIRVYLDNAPLGRTPTDADGRWRLIVERPIAPGLYTLRVDEVAGEQVAARLEFPFERADPRAMERTTMVVVVQPGNSLWRIARRTLGEGIKYTVIFEANRGRIRDPDLIYPGQVFTVPNTN